MEIKELAAKYHDMVVKLRREFHQFPELSFQEVDTSAKIQEELKSLGIPFSLFGTSVVATIEGGRPGKTVALRADIDGLPVQEETEVVYASRVPGKMHACGHDGHMAMLLVAAHLLKEVQSTLSGTVKLIFQAGEELGKGAKILIDAGVLENVDGILGIHLWIDVPVGKVSIDPGPRMASSDKFEVHIKGVGAHGSAPHQGADVAVAVSSLVSNLQAIVSREISPLEPCVVTVGTMQCGEVWNAVPGSAMLSGTTRTFSNGVREMLEPAVRRMAEATAKAYRTTAEVTFDYLVGPLNNDPHCAAIGQRAVIKLLGAEGLFHLPQMTSSEDFSEYVNEIPGAIAFVGIRNEAKKACYSHHNNKFQMDEDGLLIGAELYAQFAIEFLSE